MARFSGDWEKEFRPRWELAKLKEGNGQVGPSSNPKYKTVRHTIFIYYLLVYLSEYSLQTMDHTVNLRISHL